MMEKMAKFVKNGLYLSVIQQSWFVTYRLGHVPNNQTYVWLVCSIILNAPSL